MQLHRLRFTVRHIMFAVAIIALTIASYRWLIRAPVELVELAPQPLSASTDHDIFDIVLGDLLDSDFPVIPETD